MESIYNKRFKVEMEYIRKCLNKFAEDDEKKEPGPFYIFVYDLYQSDFKNVRKTAETKLMNMLASLHAYHPYYGHFSLFFHFLNGNFNSLDLNCFLLLRFMVLKDVEVKNDKMKFKKHKYHLHNFEITARQGAKYLIEMFKDCDQINIESILKTVFPPNVAKMCAYDFLISAIKQYKSIRQGKEVIKQAESRKSSEITESLEYFETHKSEYVDLRAKLREQMRFLVDKFIESLSKEDLPVANSRRSIIDIRDIIFSKLDNLLIALYEDNRKAWFKELLIECPEEEHISYAQELFDNFKYLVRYSVDDSEKLREFCKKILKTPQVNNQISSLLTYVFGNEESEESEQESLSQSEYYNSKPKSQAYGSSKIQGGEYSKGDKFETFRSPQYESYGHNNMHIKEVYEEEDDEESEYSREDKPYQSYGSQGDKVYSSYGSQPNSNLFMN